MTTIDLDALEARAKAATPEDDLLEKLELWWARPDGRPAGPINPDGKEAAELIRSLITRLRAAEAERDGAWQPIETAPRDGTAILGILANAYSPTAHETWWDVEWLVNGKPEQFVSSFPHGWQPTHWMPLPSIRALKKEPKT